VIARLDDRPERMCVDENGATEGALGDSALDERAADLARRRLAAGSDSAVERLPIGDADVPMFFERLAPPECVVIYGASQVAMSLVIFAHELGMRTIVIDGRARMATRTRFPLADEIHVGMPSELAERSPANSRTHVVLLAHDYKYELPVLRIVLRSEAGYVGMLGSRRRGNTIRDMLREEGFSERELARLHSPIGLTIGARSTAEIALAIAGEIVAMREQRRASAAFAPNAAIEGAAQPEHSGAAVG
jgi:xanthine dehydrogenase accessory factor